MSIQRPHPSFGVTSNFKTGKGNFFSLKDCVLPKEGRACHMRTHPSFGMCANPPFDMTMTWEVVFVLPLVPYQR